MRKDAKKISKAIRELRKRAQNHRAFTKARLKGSGKLAHELMKGFERSLNVRKLLKRKTKKILRGFTKDGK